MRVTSNQPSVRQQAGAIQQLPKIGAKLALLVPPVIFITFFLIWPVATLIGRGLFSDGHIDLAPALDLISRPRTWRLVRRTVGQAGAATIIATGLAVPLAKSLYLRRWPGRGLIKTLLTVPFVLPAVVVGLAFRLVFAQGGPLGWLHLDGSFAAVVAALVFFNLGLMVRVVGSFWVRLDPRPQQAARLLGASPTRAFWSITVRQLAPALAAGAALVFLFSATAFATVLILGGAAYGTLETEIYLQTTGLLDLRAAAVLSVMQLLIVLGALWLAGAARRRHERALHLKTGAGAVRRLAPPKREDRLAMTVTLAAAGLTALPLAGLVAGSLRTAGGLSLGNYSRLATQPVPGLAITPVQALGRSLVVGLLAMTIAVGVGACTAAALSGQPRHRWLRRVRNILDSAFLLPAGISAVTVGLGLFITLSRPPLDLRGSFWLIPLAQAVVALPLVTRALLPALRAIGPGQREAAAVLGAGPWQVFKAVDLPIMARPLALAAAYALAASLGEFGATTFLARPESTTLPVAIYQMMSRPGADNLGTALAAAVMLGTITSALVAVAEARRPHLAGAAL